MLRIPLRTDRLTADAQLQRFPPRHRLGRILAPLVCGPMARPASDRRDPALTPHRRRLGHAGVGRRHPGRLCPRPLRPLPNAQCLRRRTRGAAGAAGGDHRAFPAAAVRRPATDHRLARRTRRRDRDPGARLGLGRLCRGRGARPAGRHAGRPGGRGDGPLRPAVAGVHPDHPAVDGARSDRRLAGGVHAVAGRCGGGELHLGSRRLDTADGGVLLDQARPHP